MGSERLSTIKIKDIGRVVTGKTPPTARTELFDNDFPFITPTDIKAFDVRYFSSTERGLSLKGYEYQKQYILPRNTICYVCIGSTIGKICLTERESFTNQQINSLIVNEKYFDPIYIFYLLRTATPKIHAISGGSGSGKAILNKSSFENIDVKVHPLSVQRKIASILSAYDALIENNNRQIKILEEMAQAIYKEWFTYPFRGIMGTPSSQPSPSGRGSRKAGEGSYRLVNSELGMIPDGWVIDILENICQRITDGSHFSPKAVPNGRPMASVKDMHDWGFDIDKCKIIGEDDFQKLVRNDCKPLKDDVLIAKDGSYLKHVFVVESDMNLVILSSIAILRPNNRVNPHFLSMHLREPLVKARLKGYVSGVALPRIVLKDFRKFKILLPPKQLMDRWAEIVTPMIKNCWRLIDKNNNLRKTRDLLLPKLVRGEIDVESVNIAESE